MARGSGFKINGHFEKFEGLVATELAFRTSNGRRACDRGPIIQK